jgi:pimeloyl-ACP methyl ester carboxylesterase
VRRISHAVLIIVLLSSIVSGPPAHAVDKSDCVDPGRKLPVLFVHGFTGRPTDWDWLSSLLPVAAYAPDRFDYSGANTRWIDDSAIGPSLAAKIVCLANLSKSHGGSGKVALVAHSMGGLAAALAASMTVDGRTAGTRIAGVVTIGTPYAGSWLASATQLGGGGDVPGVGWLDRELELWLRARCGHAQVLSDVCTFITQVDTPAGHAMQIGSSALSAVPGWPSSVPVLNVGGQIHVTSKVFFGPTFELGTLGDAIVGTASATARPNSESPGGTRTVDCTIQLGTGAVFDTTLAFGTGGCYHTQLIKSNTESAGDVLTFLKAVRTRTDDAQLCTTKALSSAKDSTGHAFAVHLAPEGRKIHAFACDRGYASVSLEGGNCAAERGCGTYFFARVGYRWHLLKAENPCDFADPEIPQSIAIGLCKQVQPFNPSDLAGARTYCVVDTTPLNIRVEPGVHTASIGSIPVGACDIHDAGLHSETRPASDGHPWRHIEWQEYQGWASDSQLAASSSACLSDATASLLFRNALTIGTTGREDIHVGVCRAGWAVGAVALDGDYFASAAFTWRAPSCDAVFGGCWHYATSAASLSLFCGLLSDAGAPDAIVKDSYTGC